MAKSETPTLDEDLKEGLQQAKKKPRHFAMITKGSNVLDLIVQKKKILDKQALSAKSEAGGTEIIRGVCQGQGTEITFEVIEEQTIPPMKIKDFINERTELTVKPKWAVVKALTEVKEEDDVPSGAGQTATAAPETVAPETVAPETVAPETKARPADDPLAELSAKMKNLKPAVQSALVANPARKDDLLGPVATFKKQIEAKDATGAQQSLVAVAKLLKELSAAPAPTASATAPTTPEAPDPAYTKAKAKFAAARGTWIKVKDQAVNNIHAIRDAMVAEFKSVPELKENLARGVNELDAVAAKFNDDLKRKFDEFTADPPPAVEARDRIKGETLALIGAYRQEIEGNSIYEDLDQREFAQVLVKAPLLKALSGMAKDLA